MTSETASSTAARWPAAAVEIWPIERIKPRPNNPNTHTEEQVRAIAASMQEWGWTIPALVEPDGTLIAGAGRRLAALLLEYDEAPVIIARNWTPAQVRAYVMADNQLARLAQWDEQLLALELEALRDADFQLELIGFSAEDLERLAGLGDPPPNEDGADTVPAVESVPVSRIGDVWVCGRHRIMCGDSREVDQVAILMNGERARLLHADPPYGLDFHDEGVLNDDLKGDELTAFQLKWWQAIRPHLEPNASVYVWGLEMPLFRLWFRLEKGEPLTYRNEIVWDKKTGTNMGDAAMLRYVPATERCLFFTLGRFVFMVNQTKDDYWDGWEPIRRWLCEQRDAAGFKPGDVRRICENYMYGHWFGKSQWAFITRESYERLARAAGGKAFVRDYSDLLSEYRQAASVFKGEIRDPRALEFQAARPFFDNGHAVMTEVWDFPRVSGEDREDHATPKPVDMMERVMRSSLRESELAVEPFLGSGSTLIGAHRCGRRCFGMELDPLWVDVTVRRWERYSSLAAVLESTGETFATVEDARKKAKANVPARP